MDESQRRNRLQRIAATLRQLPSNCKSDTCELRRVDPELHLSSQAGSLLWQAIDAGAFLGDQYRLLREHASIDRATATRVIREHGKLGAAYLDAIEWRAAVQILVPELDGLEDGYALACATVADLIDAAAAAVDAHEQPQRNLRPKMQLADDLLRLAKRFRQIEAGNPGDGHFYLVRLSAQAARLVQRGETLGLWAVGVDWPGESRHGEHDALLAAIWQSYCETLGRLYSDRLPPGVGAVRWDPNPIAGGVWLGRGAERDWRERAEDYALACELLAEAVEVPDAAGPKADAKPERNPRPKRKPGPRGPRVDVAEDRRIFDGWRQWLANGGARSIEDYAREKHGARNRPEVRRIVLAVERERKRRRGKGQK
jgi:hypothetical protein